MGAVAGTFIHSLHSLWGHGESGSLDFRAAASPPPSVWIKYLHGLALHVQCVPLPPLTPLGPPFCWASNPTSRCQQRGFFSAAHSDPLLRFLASAFLSLHMPSDAPHPSTCLAVTQQSFSVSPDHVTWEQEEPGPSCRVIRKKKHLLVKQKIIFAGKKITLSKAKTKTIAEGEAR